MGNNTKTPKDIINSYEKQTHSEFFPKPSEHHVPTPYELAESVTEKDLPDLFNRLADVSKTDEYLVNILDIAAKKLNRPIGELWKEFRSCPKNKNKANKHGQFKFNSVADLYSNAGPTEWVVKSYLDKESLAMIFGNPGTLKSFVAIDIGLCVATGMAWHGNPVVQGAVFYICGEGQKGISRRVRAWERHQGINLNSVPFFVSDQPAQFLNAESAMAVVAAVNALCDEHGEPVLIIIDTLNRNFGPGDESSTADMTTFVHIVDTNLRRPFGCAVLIVHHTGHNAQIRARGSSSLRAALDWEYQADKHDMTLTLKNTKAKDSENLSPLYLRSEIITLDWVEEDEKAMTSLILRSTTETIKKNKSLIGANKIAYDTLLECVKKNGGQPVDTETWRAAAYEAKISGSEKDNSKIKAFNRAKDYILEQGLIETNEDLWILKKDKGHASDI
ncbi:MAG: hypothetical protein STSR0002_18500 [Smithella sp.]|jgi:hypothetical protein